MNEIEKIPLSKEMKILLLQVLKAGEVTHAQASEFGNYLNENGLINITSIKFVKYE